MVFYCDNSRVSLTENSWGNYIYRNLLPIDGPENGIILNSGSFGICINWDFAANGVSRFSGCSVGSNDFVTIESLVCELKSKQVSIL